MEFVDCIWELDNLGKRTCEISYNDKDVFNIDDLFNKIKSYEYVVVKVPMNMPYINARLSELGFILIETQLSISKKYKDFNFDDRLIKCLYPRVSEKIVSSEEDLCFILDRISSNMFSTDRIYLDPNFGQDCSMRRYKNWLRTEFHNNTSIIKSIVYDGNEIGFGMHREKDGITYGLLGGIYENSQSEGFGMLTACFGFLTSKKFGKPFKKTLTAISSNNVPMVQIYNYLNFKIDNMKYVFVKHNN